MKLKITALLLALLMAAFVFTSCDKETEKDVDFEISVSDTDYLKHIEIEDMEGYTFRILTRPGESWVTDQVVEEETGDIINDAVYRRNETVKSLFNIDITAIESSTDSSADALNNILAGDDEYDVIFPHARTAFTYALQNSLVNFHDVKTIDLSKEWWAQDIIENCSINNHLYVLDGDISTKRLYFAYTIFFNKDIFDELGLDYPYQLVKNGEWTFDTFAKYVKMGAKDLNGDGLMNEKDDQYGYYAIDWFGPFSVMYSGGTRIYTKNERGIPQLTLNSAKTTQIFSKFFGLTSTEDVFMRLDQVRIPSSDLFRDGRAMFADKSLGDAKSLRDMASEFGILPFPKFSEDDDYASLIGGGSSLMIMPITVEDYDRTGKILEALCALGSRDVIPAFYDVSLKTKFSRDAESEEMIDVVKGSLTYDLGYLSGGALQSTGYDLAHKSNPDFAAYYASKESKALSDLKNFLATYAKVY
ncbi:MAG: extracellular solute-binding protein [Clostridia bacterium]|nr:extracellular solute-binding protein [Clostridia bacterium]